MIPRRDRLHPAKSRMLQPAREDEVTVEPLCARRHLRERHPHLESDPRLFGQNAHRTDRPDRRYDRVEERADFRPFALEMLFEVRPAAGMRLIAIRELAAALLAAPERRLVFHRSSLRMTSFNPDQTSSTAQTLMSTNPSGKATSRMTSSMMSVLTPELFFGQETQTVPLGSIVFRSD